MVSDKQIYLHVGLPKTGTTYLQHRYFSVLGEVGFACLAEPFNRSLGLFFEELAYANPTFYPLEEKRRELEALVSKVSENKILISCEELFGWFHLNFANNGFIAETLHKLIPDAKLIIIVRGQSEWLESAYKQTLRQFSSETINGFLRFRGGAFETRRLLPGRPQINVSELNYHAYITNYARLFGRGNLLVLPFEQFQKDQSAFLLRLSSFLGVEHIEPVAGRYVNRGYSLITSHLARLINRFIVSEYHGQGLIPERPFHQYFKKRRDKNFFFRLLCSVTSRFTLNVLLEHGLDRLFYVPVRFINTQQRKKIHEMHRASNLLLEREFKPGLDGFGYY